MPGLMLVTEMEAFSAVSSQRSVSTIPSTACLAALEAACSGSDTKASTEELAIRAPPPVRRRAGSAARKPCTWPRWSTSITRWNSSGVVSSKEAKTEVAATLTQVSIRPYVCSAARATACTCSGSATSQTA